MMSSSYLYSWNCHSKICPEPENICYFRVMLQSAIKERCKRCSYFHFCLGSELHTRSEKMYIKIATALLLAVVSFTAGQENYSIACGSQNITCVCGIGTNKTYLSLELQMSVVNDSSTGKAKCAQDQDPYQACANISCVLASNGSSSLPKGNALISYFYPMEFDIPPGDFPEGHRFRRQMEGCQVTPLKNAAIKCWKWPSWMNCDINCIFGYALRDGKGTATSKNINCRSTENIWKPHGFQDCEPFLNCKVHLIKPGNLKCKEPNDGPPYCEISCLDYDQYEATSLQKYECLDDTFSRTLPHCAVLKKDVPLVQKPK